MECPICAQVFQANLIEQHVENHFLEEQNQQEEEDLEFARRMQIEERENREEQLENEELNNQLNPFDRNFEIDSDEEGKEDFIKSKTMDITWR